MNTSTDCERERMEIMASLDGESDAGAAPDRQHLSACASCQRWVEGLQSLDAQLRRVSYPGPPADLWPAVEARIGQSAIKATLSRRLWTIGALVVAWRALQLLIDLPLPMLHPVITLAAAVAALWLVAGAPLAIETWAPELEKRGV